TKSTSFKGTVAAAPTASDVKKSVTLYAGNEGEEKATRTFNYNFAGDTVKTTTIFEYALDTLTRSVSYKGEITGTPAATDVKKSITTYTGNEGEEKAKSTYNFNFDGNNIKTVTNFLYDSKDTLTKSESYRNDATTTDPTKVVLGALRSVTVYKGFEGEEKADRTFNYSFDGKAIKTTSIFEYTQDTLTKSTSCKGTVAAAPTASDVKKSVTLYAGNEGEEKATRTFNYNFAGDTVKTTTIFEYALDTLTRSVSYKGEITGTPAATDVKKSITTYTGNEGEEKAKSTYNFNFDGNNIKTVTNFLYDSKD